jgi:hypothetical protein
VGRDADEIRRFCGCKPRLSALPLAKKKTDMLRHHYITENNKLMALADLLHNFEEEIRENGVYREADGAGNNSW